jgi:hypothetical protein
MVYTALGLQKWLPPWIGVAPSVHPIYSVTLDIVSDGGLNGWKEVFFPNLREKSEPLEFVLYGIFELGEAQLSVSAMQHLVQFGECISRGNVHAGDRFCRNDKPAHRAAARQLSTRTRVTSASGQVAGEHHRQGDVRGEAQRGSRRCSGLRQSRWRQTVGAFNRYTHVPIMGPCKLPCLPS